MNKATLIFQKSLIKTNMKTNAPIIFYASLVLLCCLLFYGSINEVNEPLKYEYRVILDHDKVFIYDRSDKFVGSYQINEKINEKINQFDSIVIADNL
mgnify:CR=1 FL=1